MIFQKVCPCRFYIFTSLPSTRTSARKRSQAENVSRSPPKEISTRVLIANEPPGRNVSRPLQLLDMKYKQHIMHVIPDQNTILVCVRIFYQAKTCGGVVIAVFQSSYKTGKCSNRNMHSSFLSQRRYGTGNAQLSSRPRF